MAVRWDGGGLEAGNSSSAGSLCDAATGRVPGRPGLPVSFTRPTPRLGRHSVLRRDARHPTDCARFASPVVAQPVPSRVPNSVITESVGSAYEGPALDFTGRIEAPST